MSNDAHATSATTVASTESLFSPYRFGKVELKNRVVMAPMTRSRCPGMVPTEEVANYYKRRTEGGVGLIVTEGVTVNHAAASGHPDVPGIYGEAALKGWKRVVDEVHASGGAIIPQLWHVGSCRQSGENPVPATPGCGPSAIIHPSLVDREGAEPAQEMTRQDIDDVIAAFAERARNAEAVGFDGVEIHGAHSYLIDEFFWEETNQRRDKYGGETLAERTRFAVEIVEAVRAAVSEDFPVVLRFSQWKQGGYRHKMAKNPTELEAFLDPLTAAGVDYYHCSQRRFDDAEFDGSSLSLAGWAKKISGKPAITVGSVGLDLDFLKSYGGKIAHKAPIDALLTRLDAGEFDLVAVGRALIADPEWANKVQQGRESEIVGYEIEHLKTYY